MVPVRTDIEILVAGCLQHLAPPTRRVYGHRLNEFISTQAPLTREGVAGWAYAAKTPSVVNQRLSAIKQLVNECEIRGLLATPHATAIRALKAKKQYGVRVGNWLNLEQCAALLNSTNDARDKALLALLLGCGLRRSEVAALTLDHWAIREGRRVILDLVGKKQRVRTIPVPLWVEGHVENWLKVTPPGTQYLVQAYSVDRTTKAKLTESGVWWIVCECVRKAGLGEVKPHDLRRSFAKLAKTGGSPVDQIQLALGHSSLKTTELYLGTAQELGQGKGPGDYFKL